MNIIYNKKQHIRVNNLLQYVDGLYKFCGDGALEEVSIVYKEIAQLLTVISKDIDAELTETNKQVLNS